MSMSHQDTTQPPNSSPPIANHAKQASAPFKGSPDVITLEPPQNLHGSEEANSQPEVGYQPGATLYSSPYMPSNTLTPQPTTSRLSSSASTASDKLAEINERVNRILAPVHALENMKLFTPSAQSNPPSLPMDVSTPPQSIPAHMPASEPLPDRGNNHRGRGTRRRGNHAASGTITLASSVPGTLLTPPSYSNRSQGSGRVRGSRGSRGRGSGRGGKRRRTGEGEAMSDSDASENFTPLTQSRSGRKIIHATPSMPVIKIEDDTNASPLAGKSDGVAEGRGSGRKRGGYRKTPGGASAVCKNCGRGHSPLSNAIVFCDGCNTPWHQFCHDPPIGRDIVVIAEKEWFCSDCTVMKEEKVRLQGKVAGQNLSMLEVSQSEASALRFDVRQLISSCQKRRYFQSLPSKELVSLLLHACLLHPDLPVFNQASNGDDGAGVADEYYEDEDLLPYPKAGNGVSLRPEKERLNLLLDDDTTVFSHTTIGIAEMVAAATGGGIIPQSNGRTIRLSA